MTDNSTPTTDHIPVRLNRGGATLKFFWGPMDCGKSTLALQMDHNHARRGRNGLVLTCNDRSQQPTITTRIDLKRAAIEVTEEMNIVDLVREHNSRGLCIDYLICDEACFYTVDQIDQLADLVDEHDVDVYAFGLATDFRSELFPAARRLFEFSDEVNRLQVEVLCWCGRNGLLNARIVDGNFARKGEQVVIGDTGDPSDLSHPEVHYQVLCRRHHRAGDLGPQARSDRPIPSD